MTSDRPDLAEQIRLVEQQLHVLRALTTALTDPVATLSVIASAPDVEAAQAALWDRFGFDRVQAQAVADLQFRQATERQRELMTRQCEDLERELAQVRHAAAQQEAVTAHYDARAASYDDSGMHRALADAVAELAGDPGGPVVDVATGTGLVLRAIAARHPGHRLVGVDLSAAMLDVARSALPGARLVQADATGLPVESGTAALVTCVTALHLLDQPERAFREWARVLRRDGRLVTATFRANDAPARPDLAQGFERHHDAYRTPEQVAAATGDAGFALEDHRTWRHDTDELLLCVLRRVR